MLNARLLAIGERHQEPGQLSVGTVRGDETGDAVAPMPAAPLAAYGERRLADVGQGQRTVSGHLRRIAEEMPASAPLRRGLCAVVRSEIPDARYHLTQLKIQSEKSPAPGRHV